MRLLFLCPSSRVEDANGDHPAGTYMLNPEVCDCAVSTRHGGILYFHACQTVQSHVAPLYPAIWYVHIISSRNVILRLTYSRGYLVPRVFVAIEACVDST